MNAFDLSLFSALNFDGGPFLDQLMRFASGKLSWVPLYLLILWAIYRKFGWQCTLASFAAIAVGVAAADQVANLFKYGCRFLRPTHTPDLTGTVHTVGGYVGGLYGTVSAHAATVAVVAIVSCTLLRCRWFIAAMIVWGLLVSYSRIYLGVHFPSQILFGWINGMLFGMLMSWILRRLIRRRLLKNTPR